MKKVFGVFLVCVSLALLAGCDTPGDRRFRAQMERESVEAEAKRQAQKKVDDARHELYDRPLVLISSGATAENSLGYWKIEGSISNRTPATISWAHVQFNLLDGNLNLLGNASDTVRSLPGGGIWNFSVPVYKRGARQFQLSNLEAHF